MIILYIVNLLKKFFRKTVCDICGLKLTKRTAIWAYIEEGIKVPVCQECIEYSERKGV